ncbi:type I polyketide synthase [Kibdelosporangium phytohabitans]|nr:type I polyketide synthase [Kibdelosporangium phytohabitans]MBE1468566.1 acyl transferase domain-containing protein/NADPH-dependent curcumin reductase CurA/NAD(P)-dependent dehydrogenase (short-subunit alcohol dehydrogenase family)/acyl carrier protein [Kibdelosporangium phytohabitans]
MDEDSAVERQTPVAIIGTACRAPGGVTSAQELWQLLLDRRDVVRGSDPGRRWSDRERVVPADLVNADCLRSGSFLDDIDLFDPGFFGVPARAAASVDPQHRLLLETAWEALEDAGVPPRSLAGSRTGVFVGISGADYAKRFKLADFNAHHGISAAASGAPGRISYVLDVNGPSLAVDGSCASSLVAVHLACRSLHNGESDLALAGGVTVQLEWGGLIGFARAGALSARGRCAAFDESADGFVRGEGCGIVALKRLTDAQRDGDPVLAVITGTAINHAGRVQGITQPSRGAQHAVIRSAMRAAGVTPDDIGYVEAHGTGTPVGDPIEFAALTDAYGKSGGPCALGSLKTNIGHPESAAGVLGLIKAALAVQRGTIPANLHFTRWSPGIDTDRTRFVVPTATTDWGSAGRPRRAGVSAFGYMGANAHAIVEQAPPTLVPSQRPSADSDQAMVFPLSAASTGGLAATARRLADHVQGTADPVADVAHTLAAHRSHLSTRACAVASDRAGLVSALRSVADGEDRPDVVTGPTTDPGMPVWVFSGHGSQWPSMGRGLLDQDPAFTRMIDRLDAVAAPAGVPVRRLLASGEHLERMDVVQPVVFAVQTALAKMWRTWGLRPAAVVGHSMGEAAAAVAACMLTPEDGMRITLARSSLLQRVAGGCMAVVALPVEQVDAEIADIEGVSVAVVTAPASTVVAGDGPAVSGLLRRWQDRGVFCKQINVLVAAHSPQVDPILAEIADRTSWLSAAPATAPFYSTAVDPRETVTFDSAYWARNLRAPVRFDLACRALIEDGHRVFLELSPHPLLTQAVAETASVMGVPVVTTGSLSRDRDGRAAVCQAAAALHVAGVPLDLVAVNGGGSRISLPPTAFDRSSHWREPGRGSRDSTAHMWLGERLAVPDPEAEDGTRHVWSADLGTDRVEWLVQHTLRGTPLVPGAAHVELIVAASAAVLECALDEIRLTGVRFERMLPLAASVPVQVSATWSGGRLAVEVLQHTGSGWDRAAAAAAARFEGPVDLNPALRPPAHPAAPDELYASFRRVGLDTGAAFHSITATTDDGITRVEVPADAEIRTSAPHVHPVLFDGWVLSIAACLVRGGDLDDSDEPWLPTGVGEVVLPAQPDRVTWVRSEARREGSTVTGRAALYDEAGRWIGALEDVTLIRNTRAANVNARLDSRLFEISWRQLALPEQPAAGPVGEWVVVREPGDHDGVADRVASALVEAGTRATVHVDLSTVAERPAAVVWCATGDLDDLDRVTTVTALLRSHGQSARMWLVSRNARPVLDGDKTDAGVCALRGLLRVASIEQPESAMTWIDGDTGTPEDLADIVAELTAGTAETEVAWRAGQRYVARMTRAPLAARPPRTAREIDVVAGEDEFVLHPHPDGGLDQLRLVATDQPPPVPGPGQVLLRPEACTVHFREVLIALGIYPTGDGTLPALGSDAAGVVVAVGDGVDDLRPGDRVTSVTTDGSGSMAAHCLARADLTARIPDGFTAAEIVSSVLTYITAWHSLHDLARLRAGETVLVHSAAGGTGLAAIEVARLLGAEVIGTAGTEAKRRYLREHGVRHVFDSRSVDFAEQVSAVTGGRGVDVVLNSLTGPAMRASLDLLAPAGRFIEIGKRDLYDGARVDLGKFRHGNTYTVLDLVLTANEQPAVFRAAMRRVLTEITSGRLPLLPTTVVCLTEASEAFKQLASGDLIGRVALTFPPVGQRVRVHAPTPGHVVREGAAYIVTGGTRGLGLEAARWLAEAGASRVVLGGRGELAPDAATVLAAVAAAGCAVEVVRGDVSDPDTARRLVTAAGADLRGILHTAVVLDDAPLHAMSPDKLARAWHPKVTGLLNLHHAAEDVPLDWLVVFSSLSAMLGNAGQANYAAAGSWVDAFARWRHDQGLPTLSVNWGAWGEAGRATDFTARGFETIATADGFAALTALLRHQRVNVGVFDYQPEQLFRVFPHALDNPLLADLRTGEGIDRRAMPALKVLDEKPGPVRTGMVQDAVVHTLAALLGAQPSTVTAHAKFTDLGLDSLLAVALTRKLHVDLDIAVTPADVWAHPSPAELAKHIDSSLGSGDCPVRFAG